MLEFQIFKNPLWSFYIFFVFILMYHGCVGWKKVSPQLQHQRVKGTLAVDPASLRQGFDAECRGGPKRPFAWLPTTLQFADCLTKPMRANDWYRALREGFKFPWSNKKL